MLDSHSLEEDVIVVDRAWAERFFPGQEVLGRRLKSGGCTSCPWTTVVGVVGTVKWVGLEATETGTVYYPFVDLPNAFVVLRTAGDSKAVSSDLRRAIHDLDPGLALTNVATGDELVADALTTPRYLSVLVGMFALAALVLSIVGIYGVMAHFVQQHTRDIGIRLALGGEPSAVRGMVVWQGLRLVAIGVVLGVGVAIVGARFLATILFGVSWTDASTMLAVPAALLLTAAIACLIPGRRAARLDPAEILRSEASRFERARELAMPGRRKCRAGSRASLLSGARYLPVFFAAASTSAALMSGVVEATTTPEALTAITPASALARSGKSQITMASASPWQK